MARPCRQLGLLLLLLLARAAAYSLPKFRERIGPHLRPSSDEVEAEVSASKACSFLGRCA